MAFAATFRSRKRHGSPVRTVEDPGTDSGRRRSKEELRKAEIRRGAPAGEVTGKERGPAGKEPRTPTEEEPGPVGKGRETHREGLRRQPSGPRTDDSARSPKGEPG